MAARAGALTTPGARPGALVVDLGGGTVDVVAGDAREVVAAGAGELLTAAVATYLGLPRGAADWVKRGPCSRLESPQVLLAEDNVVNQRVGQLMLERLGHHVDTVDNGQRALLAVQSRRYDVVLMDLQMPEMDGLEATRRIRALPVEIDQPRIIAMTANAFVEDWEACTAAGMDDYLSKPVRAADLQVALARAVSTPSQLTGGG